MIRLKCFNLSERPQKVLHSIYREYQIHKNINIPDSCASRTFPSHFLFSDSDNSQIMSSLTELSANGMVRFFSNNRIMIRLQAISYIEKQLAKQKDMNL